MCAMPMLQPQVSPKAALSRAVIVKLHHNLYALDLYTDRLHTQGYTVITADNYQNTLDVVHRYQPALIIVHDDPASDVDAVHWLELQHTDRIAALTMTPLIILADSERAALLQVQELPDRVIVIRNRADTLNQLTRTVQRTLRVWGLDSTTVSR